MFDVGFTELLLIGIVALVVIGPERLPDVARTVGKWIGKTQRFVRGVKTDIANELDSGELKKLIGDQREQIDELRKVVGSTRREIESGTKDVVRGARKKLTELEDAAARSDAADDGASDEASAVRASGARTPPTGNVIGGGSTPAEGADAAARAIGRAGTADEDDSAGVEGSCPDYRATERATGPDAPAPRPAVQQVDGQVVGDTLGSANETPPDAGTPDVPIPDPAPDARPADERTPSAGDSDASSDIRQSGSGG